VDEIMSDVAAAVKDAEDQHFALIGSIIIKNQERSDDQEADARSECPAR
jgi:hypothetical protein